MLDEALAPESAGTGDEQDGNDMRDGLVPVGPCADLLRVWFAEWRAERDAERAIEGERALREVGERLERMARRRREAAAEDAERAEAERAEAEQEAAGWSETGGPEAGGPESVGPKPDGSEPGAILMEQDRGRRAGGATEGIDPVTSRVPVQDIPGLTFLDERGRRWGAPPDPGGGPRISCL